VNRVHTPRSYYEDIKRPRGWEPWDRQRRMITHHPSLSRIQSIKHDSASALSGIIQVMLPPAGDSSYPLHSCGLCLLTAAIEKTALAGYHCACLLKHVERSVLRILTFMKPSSAGMTSLSQGLICKSCKAESAPPRQDHQADTRLPTIFRETWWSLAASIKLM
jgi:hypothetical protein